jgi:hypothetical protein
MELDTLGDQNKKSDVPDRSGESEKAASSRRL